MSSQSEPQWWQWAWSVLQRGAIAMDGGHSTISKLPNKSLKGALGRSDCPWWVRNEDQSWFCSKTLMGGQTIPVGIPRSSREMRTLEKRLNSNTNSSP